MEKHIKNDDLTTAFEKHLAIDGNDRVIFSGQFGIGKSTFLKNYFQNNTRFNVIHLFPVNYSIASNEDILSLLQYDIIYELLGLKGFEIEKEDFTEIEILQMFGAAKFDELFLPMVEFIPKVGKPLVHFLKMLKKYDKFRGKAKEGDETLMKKLINEVENQKGSFYKQDAYTDFIIKSLAKLKGDDSKKQNVLIIDDLDRIDPEHIFRLFNVFAAHFDLHKEEKNKFGFDKVIFVCDIENIREIFHHKYGVNAAFTGYIDKFYSIRIFYIDNRAVLQNFINSMILPSHNNINAFLLDLLIKMIETEVINFRNIKNISHWEIIKNGNTEFDRRLYFTEVARVLSAICGDAGTLIKNLDICRNRLVEKNMNSVDSFNDRFDKIRVYLFILLIPCFDYRNHKFTTGAKELNLMESMGGINFQYSISDTNDNKLYVIGNPSQSDPKITNLFPHFWMLIIESVKLLKAEGAIN